MDNRLRPRYHFTAPAYWLNDPNGLIQWKGTFHLFYQYLPDSMTGDDKHWGHATSTDLVHWTHQPIALFPGSEGPDRDGCWSGAAVADGDGVTFVYTGVEGENQLACLAFSTDDSLNTWEKYPQNPVIASPPTDIATTIFRDHTLWKEDGFWHQVVGSGIEDAGGAVLHYRSPDLRSWEYLGPLVVEDRATIEPSWYTTGWECPDFFALGDHHILTLSLWGDRPLQVGYYSGDYADHRFVPQRHALVDFGASFYAPQSFFDESGRRVMFGWLREEISREVQAELGWSGAMSLPRILTVDEAGGLIQTPAPEIESLRGEHIHLELEACDWFRHVDLGEIDSNAIEIDSVWEWDAQGLVAFNFCSSGTEAERAVVSLSVEDGEVSIDTRESSGDSRISGGVFRGTLDLTESEPIQLRVFIDVSVIEVFVNDRTCLTARLYPTESDKGRLHISSTVAGRVDIWEMGT